MGVNPFNKSALCIVDGGLGGEGARILKLQKSCCELPERLQRGVEMVLRVKNAPILGLELSFYLVFWRAGVRN